MTECRNCSTPIGGGSTGLCRSCLAKHIAADPVCRAKRATSVARYAREHPQEISERAMRSAATKMSDPSKREALRQLMRERVQPKSYTPEAMARRDIADRARKATMKRLSWCPPEYIEQYRWLCNSKCLSTKDAKAAILEQVKRDEAKLSPFERQDRALRNGAQLVANDVAPMFGEAVKSA